MERIVLAAEGGDSDFRAFLSRFEEGTERFINGDPAVWKANAFQSDEATIMGAWGAYEKGLAHVGPRYDWAAARSPQWSEA